MAFDTTTKELGVFVLKANKSVNSEQFVEPKKRVTRLVKRVKPTHFHFLKRLPRQSGLPRAHGVAHWELNLEVRDMLMVTEGSFLVLSIQRVACEAPCVLGICRDCQGG